MNGPVNTAFPMESGSLADGCIERLNYLFEDGNSLGDRLPTSLVYIPTIRVRVAFSVRVVSNRMMRPC